MPTSGPHVVAFAIRGPIARADLSGLCDRVRGVLRSGEEVVACDLSSVRADAVAIDALARLQLAALRGGCRVELRNMPADLAGLVALVGLTEVFAAVGRPHAVSPLASGGTLRHGRLHAQEPE